MNNDIQPFVFPETGQQVRMITRNDEPWFVATDVCAVLEINNARQAVSYLDADEKDVTTNDTLGGRQKLNVINEAGLYSIVLRSRKPEAKAFKRWITHDVLPSIRKKGSYSVGAVQTFNIPQTYPEALREIANKVEALEASEKYAKELEPKAEAHDELMTAPGALLVREAAKALGMRGKVLRAFLLGEKLLFTRQILCGTTQYDFYAQYAEHFMSKLTVVEHNFGGKCVHTTLSVTPQGMGLIRKRLAEQSTEIAIAAGGAR